MHHAVPGFILIRTLTYVPRFTAALLAPDLHLISPRAQFTECKLGAEIRCGLFVCVRRPGPRKGTQRKRPFSPARSFCSTDFPRCRRTKKGWKLRYLAGVLAGEKVRLHTQSSTKRVEEEKTEDETKRREEPPIIKDCSGFASLAFWYA